MRNCSSGKVCYETLFTAQEAFIHVLATQQDTPHRANGIYRCDICECYHLTSKSRDFSWMNDTEFLKRLEQHKRRLKWE